MSTAVSQLGPHVTIDSIATYLPACVLSNEELAPEVGWSAQQIFQKTGIRQRHIAAQNECVSDMTVSAVRQLMKDRGLGPEDVQFLILCTQTPDRLLPTTACVVHEQLGLHASCAAFDINQGCSGYIYALAVAAGFIRGGLFPAGIIVTADTYSKFIHPADRSVRTLFGDAATATYVAASSSPGLGQFVLGTDGRGAGSLCIPAGGTRQPRNEQTAIEHVDESGNSRTANNLYMDGPAVFAFAARQVPKVVEQTLLANRLATSEIDGFVFHQASRLMLDRLRDKLRIPAERMVERLEDVGNTVSCSIPLALAHATAAGRLTSGQQLLLVGFGVGWSWGGVAMRWTGQVAEIGRPR